MNKQAMRLLIACALAVPIVMVYTRSNKPKAPAVVTEVEAPTDGMLEVVVAKAPLEQYTRVIPQHVTTRKFPAHLMPQGATQLTSDVIGKEVLEEVYPGEMIMITRLQDPGEGPTSISSFLGDGERAITVKVPHLYASGGFIQQGDIVDVIATLPTESDETVETIISNIKVMAVGGDYRRRLSKNASKTIKGAGKPILITLAVTGVMANKIQHLGSRTRFNLVLKNPKDTTEVETEGWQFSKLLRENLPPEMFPPEEKEELKYLVTVIEGVKERQEEIAFETEDPENPGGEAAGGGF